ncbi:MAG: hypothetical protein U0441_26140 [Polyangiaceae bacterium]
MSVQPPSFVLIVDGRYRITTPPRGRSAETCVDMRDGRPLLARPVSTGFGGEFTEWERGETAARLARGIESPWVLRVLASTPRVVYAAPPELARPDAPLPVPEAVECLLQVCDVLAKAHALRISAFGADPEDLRVHRENGAFRATVILPRLTPLRDPLLAARPPATFAPVRYDLYTAASFFRDIVTGYVPWSFHPGRGDSPEDDEPREPPPLPDLGDARLRRAILDLLSRRHQIPEIPDVASLAALAAPLSRWPAEWQSRIASLPRVASFTPAVDWDRRVELGEHVVRGRKRGPDESIAYPLAAAYHQRALAAHARGATEAADRDLARALTLDRWARYLVTRGLFRLERGEDDAATEDFEEAVRLAEKAAEETGRDPYELAPLDFARALHTRGVTRYRRGDLAGAAQDLARAADEITAGLEAELDREAPMPESTAAFQATVNRHLAAVKQRLEQAPSKA